MGLTSTLIAFDSMASQEELIPSLLPPSLLEVDATPTLLEVSFDTNSSLCSLSRPHALKSRGGLLFFKQ